MADDVNVPLDPERIRSRSFSTVRRGADPSEVQAFLRRVATELATAQDRANELQRELDLLRSAPAEPAVDPLDPSNLTRVLGEETVRVLDAAQAAAAEIRARAEEGVARLLHDAREQANSMRESAESVLAERTERAEVEAASIRERSKDELERAQVEAARIIEDSKREGRALVMEAQQHRKRLLEDLAERQASMRDQIEQLQAGRDRLMAAYDAVRESVSSATRELQGAFPTAAEVAEVDTIVDAAANPGSVADDLGAATVATAPEVRSDTPDATSTDVDGSDTPPAAGDTTAETPMPGAPSPTGTVRLIRPEPVVAPAPDDASTPGVPFDGDAGESGESAEATELDDITSTDSTDDSTIDSSGATAGGLTGHTPTPAADLVTGDAGPPSATSASASSIPEVQTPGGPIRSAALPTSLRPSSPAPAAPTEPKVVDAPKPERPPADPRPQGSSVRVVRASSGKVSDVFERLRKEGAEEAQRAAEEAAVASDGGGSSSGTRPDASAATATPSGSKASRSSKGDVDGDDATADPIQELIAKRDQVVSQLQTSLSRRIKREFSHQQNEMLAAIASVRGTVTVHDILPMPGDQLERYDDLALAILGDAAEAGASLGRGRRNGSRSSVADIASGLAAAVIMPLRARLEAAVEASGHDRDALAKSIRTVFREWKGNVDESVLLHVGTAVNRGLLDTTAKGAKVRWVIAEGDEPGPDCLENARAGSVTCGSPFPSGLVVPPSAAGCRCIVVAG